MLLRRSREVNVFSMSALDLFASAMGAFILMMIVLMPTFPNVSPIEILAPPPPEPPPPAPPAPSDTQFPALDLVVVLDVTDSMEDSFEGARGDIDNLIQVLSVMSPSLSVGVVGYGDRLWSGRHLIPFPLQTLTDSPAGQVALRNFILEDLDINAGCSVPENCPRAENDSYEEDLLLALREAVDMEWREESERKVILVLTDAPAYPEDAQQVIAEARAFAGTGEGYEVSTVFFDTRKYGQFGVDREDIQRFLQQVRAGEGRFVDAGASFLAAVLLALL